MRKKLRAKANKRVWRKGLKSKSINALRLRPMRGGIRL